MPESDRFDRTIVDDLRHRLRSSRWPDAPLGAGWSLGADVEELRSLTQYWADGFDFDAHRAMLDELPSFRHTVYGASVHYLHRRTGGTFPILLAHGWPDSGWRYRRVLPLLAEAGLDVVIPDMPGYGFSDIPSGPPLSSGDVAKMWAQLMSDLGYDQFAVAGGDIGSAVARWLAVDYPNRIIAVHRTDAGFPVFDGELRDLTDQERDWFEAAALWQQEEGAYASMHRTKPQTAAVGLTDSPAGLAAWIVEKLRTWSDTSEGGFSAIDRDDVLTLLTEYWTTATIGASMRMYQSNAQLPRKDLTRRVEVPSGFTLSPPTSPNLPSPGWNAPPTSSTSHARRGAATSPPSSNPTSTQQSC